MQARRTQPAPLPDGRNERSRRTRTAVIDAVLELNQEGELSPSAKRVAERAGISARTMYLHFADMESLFVEAGDRFLNRLAGIGEPVPPNAPLATRLDLFCARRVQVLEALLPVFRASRLRQPFSRALQSNRDRYVTASDLEVDAVFARELDPLPGKDAAAVRAGIHLATCAAGWDVLRDDRRLDIAQATAVMHRTLKGLLS